MRDYEENRSPIVHKSESELNSFNFSNLMNLIDLMNSV